MSDFLQNFFDFFSPNERLGIFVIEPSEIFDRGDQLRHALEHTTPDPLTGDLPKPSLYQV